MANTGKARRKPQSAIAAIVLGLLIAGGVAGAGVANAQSQPKTPKAGGWLGKIPADKQMEAVDRQLRGFDMAMFETNYRYTEMYFGAIEGNWDYAAYTGEKISWAITNGYERRPKRKNSALEIFFKEAYPNVMDAIKKKDIALFKERFDALRAACNACHTAEKVEFIHVGVPSIKQTPLVN